VTHPDKILLLVEECENLQSASTHLKFSMERTRELIQRIRDEISSEELERLESLTLYADIWVVGWSPPNSHWLAIARNSPQEFASVRKSQRSN